MPFVVNNAFRNLPAGLEIPDASLVVLTGSNNTGKSAILQYLNVHSEIREPLRVSCRLFGLSLGLLA